MLLSWKLKFEICPLIDNKHVFLLNLRSLEITEIIIVKSLRFCHKSKYC